MIFVCFVVFTFLFVAFFGGGKLSLDFHDLFYNLNFEKEKLLLKDLFEGCLILTILSELSVTKKCILICLMMIKCMRICLRGRKDSSVLWEISIRL